MIALDLLNRKYFDVAIVDLQLRDDITHKGGVDVLKYIDEIDEGVLSYVLSGSPEIKDALKSYKQNIVDFIHKDEADIFEIFESIEYETQKRKTNRWFGSYPSLAAYLAAPNIAPIWEDGLCRHLDCSNNVFQDVLWKALGNLSPILRRKGLENPFNTDQPLVATGSFWSKIEGAPIKLYLSKDLRAVEEASSEYGEPVKISKHNSPIKFAIYQDLSKSRNEFYEFLGDVSQIS